MSPHLTVDGMSSQHLDELRHLLTHLTEVLLLHMPLLLHPVMLLLLVLTIKILDLPAMQLTVDAADHQRINALVLRQIPWLWVHHQDTQILHHHLEMLLLPGRT